MRRPFREHHLLEILPSFDAQTLPLDLFLRNYFRKNTAIGSKDRKEICHLIYTMIRWRALLDYVAKGTLNWESRYLALMQNPLESLQNDSSIPPHIRVSFPKAFYDYLVQSLGLETATAFCLASNDTAPTTIRVNTLVTSREDLIKKWNHAYPISKSAHSQLGIHFKEKINFFGLEEFKAGCFEIQDEASQLIADLVKIQPGQRFLDYCAGSGGKSLAIAPRLHPKGQLFLHDIRDHALQEAKKRLKRAHIQNAQLLFHDSPNKALIKGKMDWVLVDAPCSGTGTLRRNPDMKWKFEEAMVTRLVSEQRMIFKEALNYVKPSGHIVYATCSVLPQENGFQSAYFLENFPVELVSEPFSTFPQPGEMDGFFGVVFKKKKP